MTTTSFTRGHLIEYINDKWLYADNWSDAAINRPCVRCGKMPTPEGYDACLGYLENVKSACCGHGIEEPIRKAQYE